MDLQTCTRSRATRRTIIDRLLITLEAAILADDVVQVEVELAKLKQKEADLIVVHHRMEELIYADPQATDAEIVLNEEYADKIIASKVVANRFLADKRNKPAVGVTAAKTSTSGQHTVKLPKLQITAFKGEVKDWERFWDQFQAGVHNSLSLSKIDKFNYLKTLLTEAAQLTIAGLSLTEANYDIALNLLKDKYGKPEVLIAEHIQQLWATKRVPRVEDGSELRRMLETFKMHVNSLETLGQDISSMGPVFCHILLQALPRGLILEWNRQNLSSPNNDLPKLVAFVKGELEGIELANRTMTLRNESVSKREESNKSHKGRSFNTSSASSLLATSDQSTKGKAKFNRVRDCLFCGSTSHWTSSCDKYVSNQARRDALKGAKRCFNCLGTEHTFRECTREIVCRQCERKHHTLLCPNRESTNAQKFHSNQSSIPSGNHPGTQGARSSAKPLQEESSKENKTALVASTVTRSRSKLVSVLQIMRLWIRHKGGKQPVTVLFDEGSERSFITKDIASKLGLPISKQEDLVVHSFGGKRERQSSAQVKFTLVGSNDAEITLEAAQVLEICSGVTLWDAARIENFLQSKRNFSWFQAMGAGESTSVDVLIGADYYWQVMTGHMKRLSASLMATQSIFGWVLQGRVDALAQNIRVVTLLSVLPKEDTSFQSDLEDRLRIFWDLDRSGAMSREESSTQTLGDIEVLEHFERTTIQTNGRYQVRIPWNNQQHQLSHNYALAKERLRRLLLRLQDDPPLLARYREGIYEYLKNGHTEEVTTVEEVDPVYYMPHHPVIKEDRQTTKLRIVFDASSHEKGVLSLNQCQYTGPNLNPRIFDLLLRFRWHYVGITSDMEKAFLQVSLAPEDRDATRFIWTDDHWTQGSQPRFKIFRMTRVLFGMKASPFLLAATIRHHAKSIAEKDPTLYKVFQEDTYVDDMVTGTANTEEAYRLYSDSRQLMALGSMNLVKWATNDPQLRKRWMEEGVIAQEEPVELLKVLGLVWDPAADTFSYKCDNLLQAVSVSKFSKRGVLETLARLYDPLGFLAPKTVQAKATLQDLWKLKLGWDDPMPDSMQDSWTQWLEDLQHLRGIKIPRCCQPFAASKDNYQLHIFSDSSLKAYGAVAYLRATDDASQLSVKMIAAKSRVAPIALMSIPRLELLACLVAARLATDIQTAWGSTEYDTYIWSDSKVALAWIAGVPSAWKLFVARRVQEIQQCRAQWNYCETKENPADVLTHGQSLVKLKSNEHWWSGPTWLKREVDSWSRPVQSIEEDDMQQVQQETAVTVTSQIIVLPEPVFPVGQYGTWSKIVRVTAWMLRFALNCQSKEKQKTEFLSFAEIQQAELVWFKYMQELEFPEELKKLKEGSPLSTTSPLLRFNPMLDQEGLIRLGGRLRFANLGEALQHPIILRGEGLAQLLIRDRHLRTCHGGIQETLIKLRRTVWILKGRQSVRTAIHDCYICRRWAAKPSPVLEAPLPAARVNQSNAFHCTGIDFAGPVWVRAGTEKTKGYICLFTCAVTRAVHLELVSSLEIRHFVLAFRRFIARRGGCRIIYSDNSKTLQQADRLLKEAWQGVTNKTLQEQATQLGIEWRFIPPRAAWFGGFYERLVGSVKKHLKRTLGQALLQADELATILTEIEAVINNRPLVSVTEDPEDTDYLTPSHFLIGRTNEALGDLVPGLTAVPAKPSLIRRWRYRKQLMQQFWKQWRDEYLLQLQSAHQVQNPKSQNPVKIGDIVLKREEKLPRGQWKLARVVELTEGRDGKVRSVVLRQANGQQMRRSILHICPLEVV